LAVDHTQTAENAEVRTDREQLATVEGWKIQRVSDEKSLT
jgi:hypothetical protein